MKQTLLNYWHHLRQAAFWRWGWRAAAVAIVAIASMTALAPSAQAGQIVMYWDRGHLEDLGSSAGLELRGNYFGSELDIPAEACGFRLGKPNEDWDGGWHFAQWMNLGAPVQGPGVTYSSSWFGTGPAPISALGPINGGCSTSSGLYEFQTPASNLIGFEMPEGAGAFVADIYDGSDLEWLDSGGKPIKRKEDKPPKPPKLPKEFFEDVTKQGCIQDFDGKQHCDRTGSALVVQPGDKIRPISLAATPPGQAMLMLAEDPATAAASKSRKIEVSCPSKLILKGTIFKTHGFDPATVEYRFRWAHGPVSTLFSTFVGEDRADVTHKVPIPLPPPIQRTGSSGGGVGSQMLNPALQQGTGGGSSGIAIDPVFTDRPLPQNEHKSAVRLEVVNIEEGGVVASNWWNYHIACKPKPSNVPIRNGGFRQAIR
ncbi:MAG: hypothetical protein ICV62_13665 [Cyanobacteria bacterium Co-bin13]|nr:hypothetical protein [Cyanobacteria bacterium Co-bin13]